MRAVLLLAVLVGCSGTGRDAAEETGKRSGPAAVVEIDAGNDHTCVRLDDGQVECWGQCNRQCGSRPDGVAERMVVPGVSNAVELAVADNHACARLENGDVSCWGTNLGGELGRLEPDRSSLPLPVPDVHDAVEIAIGGSLTCARQRSGVTCWGSASGDYATTPEAARARLPAQVKGLGETQSIRVDINSACASTGEGAWSCWTWNAAAPDYVHRMGAAFVDPSKQGVTQFTRTECDCDLDRDGVVHCTGTGILSARLADGSSPPVQLHACPADGLVNVRLLGERCAVMNDDTVRCWGPDAPTPVEGITGVRALAEGSDHTCVLTHAGDVLCWGRNTYGQIDGHPAEGMVWPPRRVAASPTGSESE